MVFVNRSILRSGLIVLFLVFIAAACGRNVTPQEDQPETTTQIQVVPIDMQLVILADLASLRAGPGLNYEDLGNIRRDTLVSATGQTPDGRWLRIQGAGGNLNEAWIGSEFTIPAWFATQRAMESAAPTATSTPLPDPGGSTAFIPMVIRSDAPTPIIVVEIPTSTPGPALVSGTAATVCLEGASSVFDALGVLMPEDDAEVLGRSPDGLWWVIRNPDWPNGSCWIWREATVVRGDVSQVLVVIPPPIPTITSQPTVFLPFTPTPEVVALPTSTATNSPTDTSTVVPTLVVIASPTPTTTSTPTAIATLPATDTSTPTLTSTATATQTATPTERPTLAEPDTPTPTATTGPTGVPPIGTP